VKARPAELASPFAGLRGAALAPIGGGATDDAIPPMPVEATVRTSF